jgi:hypothetical protein
MEFDKSKFDEDTFDKNNSIECEKTDCIYFRKEELSEKSTPKDPLKPYKAICDKNMFKHDCCPEECSEYTSKNAGKL